MTFFFAGIVFAVTVFAHKHQVIARLVGAIFKITSFS